MTNIGIISDIHGNLDGLERAIALLQAHEVAEIWCAGDLVDRGDDANEVVERVRLSSMPCVQGNHDFSVRRTQERLINDLRFMDYLAEDPQLPENAPELMLSATISEPNLRYLDNLPRDLWFARDGLHLHLTHASTFDRTSYIYPNSRRTLFFDVLDATNSDIVILGHTHKPMKIYENGKLRIINSGSCYMNYGLPEQSCGILSLPQREFTIYDARTGKAVPVPNVHL